MLGVRFRVLSLGLLRAQDLTSNCKLLDAELGFREWKPSRSVCIISPVRVL